MALLSLDAALTATALLIGFAGILSGLEGRAGRYEILAGGLLDVSVADQGRRLLPAWRPPTRWVPGVWSALLLCSALLVTAVVLGSSAIVALALVGAALCVALQGALLPYGRDGSDEIAIVVTVPVAVVYVLGAPEAAVRIVLFFVAAQLTLSYLAAGVAKLGGAYWRDGSAVPRIARTASYGHPMVAARLTRHSAAGRVATWGLVAWELAIPVALVLGGVPALIALACGVGFHAITALVVGLNRFLPWFLTAYPATLYVTSHYGLLS